MAKKPILKPVAAALGTTFAVALAASPLVNAAENPFSLTNLESGYMVAGDTEGKCGEGKCGESKTEAEGACGEAKTDAEGACGEAKTDAEGACGEAKTDAEGKCGEGKCGGDK